jgi:hypothetical protein
VSLVLHHLRPRTFRAFLTAQFHDDRFEVPGENLSTKHYHTMRLWHMELPIHAEGWLELVVRAWGSCFPSLSCPPPPFLHIIASNTEEQCADAASPLTRQRHQHPADLVRLAFLPLPLPASEAVRLILFSSFFAAFDRRGTLVCCLLLSPSLDKPFGPTDPLFSFFLCSPSRHQFR